MSLDKKITELDEAASLNDIDFLTAVQGINNIKITSENAGLVETNSALTTVTVGGLLAGSSIVGDNPIEILNKILYPYQEPEFTSFSTSIANIVEVGTTISGLVTFTWGISNAFNMQPNSIYIKDITNNLTLIVAHPIASPANYDFSLYPGGGLDYIVPTTNVFQIQGTNTQSGALSRNRAVNWYWGAYSGANVNDTLNNSQILALNKVLIATFPTTAFFAGGDTYFWYWIPESFAQPNYVNGFRNASTGLPIAMQAPVTQAVTNVNGVITNYKGYRSTEILTNSVNVTISS